MLSIPQPNGKEKISSYSPELLFKSLWTPLVYFATRLTGNKDGAKDVVADVFVAILKSGKTFETYDLGKSYLFLSVRNRCYNFLKMEKKVSQENADLIHMFPAWEDTDLLAMDQTERLEQLCNEAIDSLEERSRVFMELCGNGNISMTEIARLTGHASANAASYKKHTIRQYLKSYIRNKL